MQTLNIRKSDNYWFPPDLKVKGLWKRTSNIAYRWGSGSRWGQDE